MLKVCLPKSVSPDKAQTTHPAVVRALVNVLGEFGVECIVADCPVGSFTTSKLDAVYFETGMLEVANLTKCKLNHNLKTKLFEVEDGVKCKNATLLSIIDNVDAIINVGKLKFDDGFGYLGAVSNMFGFVPGKLKDVVLNRLKTVEDFNEYCVDIMSKIKNKLILNIVDGVVALESGKSERLVSCLGVSENAFCLDSALLSIFGADLKNSVVELGIKHKYLNKEWLFELTDEKLEKFKIEDFNVGEVDATTSLHKNKFMQKVKFACLQHKVTVAKHNCKGCGTCSKICPTGAISMKYDKHGELYAEIDYDKCVFYLRNMSKNDILFFGWKKHV
ncbi:MAG: DUF362 domain-containing protein [Clostridia bacterium]|nr:DUF362 domain-containing protein [Clostridia bacterium]